MNKQTPRPESASELISNTLRHNNIALPFPFSGGTGIKGRAESAHHGNGYVVLHARIKLSFAHVPKLRKESEQHEQL
jgi:hypothetical protein